METLINIDVPDLEHAIRFYREAVGLRLQRKLFGDSVAEMTGATVPIFLVRKPEGTAPFPQSLPARSYERHWTPLHLDFIVNDLDPAIRQAIKAGATLETEPQSFDWGRLATLSDPFGHGFCLLQWLGKGYDETDQQT